MGNELVIVCCKVRLLVDRLLDRVTIDVLVGMMFVYDTVMCCLSKWC